MRIADMHWSMVEKYLEIDDRCVLPIGSTEQHGRLSLCVDAILAEQIAIEAAEPLGVPVYPAMPFGCAPYFSAFPGSISLRVETLLAVVRDVIGSMHTSGFRRVLIVNGHGGNAAVGNLCRELLAERPDMSIRFHNWWLGPRVEAKAREIAPDPSHANWFENFPWTRLGDVAPPGEDKPLVDIGTLKQSGPARVRVLLGDGSFGGPFQQDDAEMADLWKVGVEETRNELGASVADPILIWGAGAIGGTLGAYWARAGVDVLLVDIVPEHVEACRTTGLNIKGPVETFKQSVPAVTPDEVEGHFSRVVLAVKALDTATAVTTLKPHLSENGFVLSAQNGLNELEISRQVGEDRTMGSFVNFGADWLGPGHILFGNRGAVVVGEVDGRQRERTKEMFELLQVFEPDAILTDNIWGFLWGKLAYGAMLFATALNMESMSDNFANPKRFPVWRKLGAEVMDAAAARGVTPVGFDGFAPSSFARSSSDASARQSVADLAAFNRGSAKTHSGVWRDLAVRTRRTEIDAQIGIIAQLSAEVGVETPAINRLVDLVHDVECGRRKQSLETFNELLAICP